MNDRQRKPWRIRFSLRMLLIVAPFIAAVIAWLAPHLLPHDETEVTAYLQVVRLPYALYEPPTDPRIDLVEATPDDIFLDAIRSLSTTSRAWIDARGDAVAWLRHNVHLKAIGKSDLLQIAIENNTPTPKETRVERELINALALSFSKAAPSGFHALFARYPAGIQVVRCAQVDRKRHGWF